MSRCPVSSLLVRIAVLTLRLAAAATTDFKLRRAVASCADYVDAMVREAT